MCDRGSAVVLGRCAQHDHTLQAFVHVLGIQCSVLSAARAARQPADPVTGCCHLCGLMLSALL